MSARSRTSYTSSTRMSGFSADTYFAPRRGPRGQHRDRIIALEEHVGTGHGLLDDLEVADRSRLDALLVVIAVELVDTGHGLLDASFVLIALDLARFDHGASQGPLPRSPSPLHPNMIETRSDSCVVQTK